MSGVRYRRRGTAIVETGREILLTAGRHGRPFILPGGGAKRDESRFVAALRELTEDGTQNSIFPKCLSVSAS